MKYRRGQSSGVALVITLIMLSVITLIAVAFLLLSQRERASVSSTITATEAELMLGTGLDRAKGQILADMAAFMGNPTNRIGTNSALHPYQPNAWIPRLTLGPDLLVSITDTNYTNAPYLTPGLRQNDLAAIGSLLQDPRAPVFVRNRAGGTNFVFYLDLNRNGRFEPSGIVQEPGANRFRYAIGDPEWVGVLARINEAHSRSNRFIGRYAYLIVPAGRALNIDYIHNEAKRLTRNGFFRKQGHGSWEINLAGFLADLNTNFYQWGQYTFNTDIATPSAGAAFDDAYDILNYRYAAGPLRTGRDVFGARADAFIGDGIDQFADGNDVTGADNDDPDRPWPGASNPQHFFTAHDFFNAKNPAIFNFQSRLTNAGGLLDSYNAHTFYRMLAQLSTDSAPEKRSYFMTNEAIVHLTDKGPINLNYNNLKYSPTNELTATQFVPWTAEEFFHAAADRILREHGFVDHTGRNFLSVTNLQVYPTNFYTPAVHRILQMTLNIYDATTNRTEGASGYPYPTALRPVFGNNGNEIFITRYEQVPKGYQNAITNALKWRDLSAQADRDNLAADDFVYGVPILIGAKKGYPNFNEFVFQSDLQFERRVQVWKDANTPRPTHAAQMFFVGVSNSFGLEAWNSYTSAFPRALEMFTGVEVTSVLSNDEGFRTTTNFVASSRTNLPAGAWLGRQFRDVERVVTNLWTNSVVVPYRGYSPQSKAFFLGNQWDTSFAAPQWVLSNSVQVRFFLFDNGHLVDAAGLAPVVLSTNVTAAVAAAGLYGLLWDTNRVAGRGSLANVRMTRGVQTQMDISQGGTPLGNVDWNDFGTFRNTLQEKQGFFNFLNTSSNSPVAVTNQAPFTPQVKIYRRVEWKANDPLVHHLDEDLRRDRESKPNFSGASPLYARNRLVFDLGKKNVEYESWSGDGKAFAPGREHLWDPSSIDPSIQNSDSWDFPTHKFPTVGWLGRVHRGTPWQTIYWKSLAASMQRWTNVHASVRSHPTNDWRLADIFTVAQHPNASRGRLSVNQTNAAAWSALFSGIEVPVLTDASGTLTVTTNIVEPAFVSPPLAALVQSINARRESLPGQVFTSLAEFLAVPELSTNSPYLTPPFAPAIADPTQNPLKDEHYEALAEKILSLVKPGEARFVVYVFGQSLKPAVVIPGGPFRGLCVNYEVTGEMAAKAVMRVDSTARPNGPPRLQAVIESFNLLPPD